MFNMSWTRDHSTTQPRCERPALQPTQPLALTTAPPPSSAPPSPRLPHLNPPHTLTLSPFSHKPTITIRRSPPLFSPKPFLPKSKTFGFNLSRVYASLDLVCDHCTFFFTKLPVAPRFLIVCLVHSSHDVKVIRNICVMYAMYVWYIRCSPLKVIPRPAHSTYQTGFVPNWLHHPLRHDQIVQARSLFWKTNLCKQKSFRPTISTDAIQIHRPLSYARSRFLRI